MSEKLLLVIAGVCDSVLAIASAFVQMPMIVMLALAIVPMLACIPFFGKKA